MIDREKIDLYEDALSELFPRIAQKLIIYPLRMEYLSYVKAEIRKQRQIVFEGNMVSEEDFGDWNDRVAPFSAIVTDKRITKQGIWIKIQVGEYSGEGDLFEIFD